MPYLAADGDVCQSSANDISKEVVGSDHMCMSKCSNSILCKNKVVVVAL